jgi:hypothetical protein
MLKTDYDVLKNLRLFASSNPVHKTMLGAQNDNLQVL